MISNQKTNRFCTLAEGPGNLARLLCNPRAVGLPHRAPYLDGRCFQRM
jgi:hypothetical protein